VDCDEFVVVVVLVGEEDDDVLEVDVVVVVEEEGTLPSLFYKTSPYIWHNLHPTNDHYVNVSCPCHHLVFRQVATKNIFQ